MVVKKEQQPKGAISIEIHNSSLENNLSPKSVILASEAKIDSSTNKLNYSFKSNKNIEVDKSKIIKEITGYLAFYFELKDKFKAEEKLEEIQLEEILSEETNPDEILERLWSSE